jgi:DNA-binding GntR family transcriptional regulator
MQEPEDDRSIAAVIARALAERIISGDIPAEASLRQDHIAAEFGASHVPVREAFRRLEAQGLAVALPRRGVRVAAITSDAVVEVTKMRAALEVLALRSAMPRLGPDDLSAARQAQAEIAASREIRVWEAANRRFHRALVAPCAMPRLLAAIDDLHRASARYLFATWRDLDWQPRSEDEHRALLAAVTIGDVDDAARVLEAHITAAGLALAAIVTPSAAAASPASRRTAAPRRREMR